MDYNRQIKTITIDGHQMQLAPSGAYATYASIVNKTATVITGNDLQGLTSIPSTFQSSNYLLTSFEWPQSVSATGNNCLSECSSLVSVKVPNSINTISNGTFYYTPYTFTKLDLPNSIASIAGNAFAGSKVLIFIFRTVALDITGVPTLASTAFSSIPVNYKIYVPYQSITYYKMATNWVNQASKIFPLVDTVADLSSIDTTTYTYAYVSATYKAYVYTNNEWVEA